MSHWLILLPTVFLSFVLTELIRRYTLAKEMIDIPNERSSHTVPTPRGGGLSFVVIFLVGIIFIDSISTGVLYALLGSGIMVAAVGFWDDHNHIPAKWRLLLHFLASIWVLAWLGGISEIHVLNFSIDMGFFSLVLVSFILVWLLNLFNFMDGIDGIAACEAIFVLSAAAFFQWQYSLESLQIVSLILAASVFGFLILNWPPAKIFMGDVGSGFLGLMIGIIAYTSVLQGFSIWIWIILLAIFLVDSGVTLLRRIYLREKWYEAHCSHAYQHAAKIWGHKSVTIAISLINILWLFPLAYLIHLKPDFAVIVTIIAYLPIIYTAFKLNAGLTHYEQAQN